MRRYQSDRIWQTYLRMSSRFLVIRLWNPSFIGLLVLDATSNDSYLSSTATLISSGNVNTINNTSPTNNPSQYDSRSITDEPACYILDVSAIFADTMEALYSTDDAPTYTGGEIDDCLVWDVLSCSRFDECAKQPNDRFHLVQQQPANHINEY